MAEAARAKYILGDKMKSDIVCGALKCPQIALEREGVQVDWRVIRRHEVYRIQCTSQETKKKKKKGIQWLHDEGG